MAFREFGRYESYNSPLQSQTSRMEIKAGVWRYILYTLKAKCDFKAKKGLLKASSIITTVWWARWKNSHKRGQQLILSLSVRDYDHLNFSIKFSSIILCSGLICYFTFALRMGWPSNLMDCAVALSSWRLKLRSKFNNISFILFQSHKYKF